MISSRGNNCRAAVIASLIGALFSGCTGGDGSSLPARVPPGAIGPNFSEIQASILEPNCATIGCHLGAAAPQGLRLDSANSYAMLVSVASTEASSILRVAPGNPDNSYLIQKLEGTATVGAQMPLGAPALEQATIDVIRQWIGDGAFDDRLPSSNPIKVTSLSPDPGSTLSTAPANIVAMFDRELDVSTVNSMTFLLESSGGDGTFDDGNETAIGASGISAGPTTATFDLAGATLVNDTYRVRLLGSGPSIVMDLDANALDGEYFGTFPTGDNVQGGDFEATFLLDVPVSAATLDALQASVFTPSCAVSGCHTGPTGGALPSGLNLSSADASFANLVGVASVQQPALSRVAVGDPDNSYLVQKVEGTAASGSRMPLGGGALDQALIDDLREWISNGANR
ncbi:MAG: Ig-like domain-containing protein [Gammaproteobacteria bacterium]|nr:Ig-like domain-containing protein [Gammaproteobacteria bacterium]MDH5618981.1 Ig-like domain-containing protein [Gammaproteobacteria bacterium]